VPPLAGVAISGDHVGVGCFVDSCLECKQCKAGDEQYCEKSATFTYGAIPSHGRANSAPGIEMSPTFGGYSNQMVIHERFAIKIPKSYPLDKAGPLMCAAITMYDPMKHWGVKAGTRVGIMGLGGLGGMGVKLAKALGAHVTVISRSETKRAMAMKAGADAYIASDDAAQMSAGTKLLDLILDTIAANHDIMHYLGLLDVSGTIVTLGLCTMPHTVPQLPLIFNRTGVHGSLIGGIRSTQECMDLCAAHEIYPETKIVPVSDVIFFLLTADLLFVIRYFVITK